MIKCACEQKVPLRNLVEQRRVEDKDLALDGADPIKVATSFLRLQVAMLAGKLCDISASSKASC
jgi:hypothetical protein